MGAVPRPVSAMPANLPPQYHEAERRYRTARTVPEKIAALQEMLALMPKHKGTDHLRAELRAKMARLMDELEHPAGPRGNRSHPFAIPKEGAGQAALVGPPNSGKSSILAALTGAPAKVAHYPFTTQLPQPGMARFQDVHIQLVDTPPLAEGRLEGRLFGLLRNADALLLVTDLSAGAVAQAEGTIALLEGWGIEPLGRQQRPDPAHWQVQKPLVVVGNKADLEGALDEFQRLEAALGDRFPVVMVSVQEGVGLDDLVREAFLALGVIRVYTKPPGESPRLDAPLVLPAGSTVEEAAESLHKSWRQRLKYALVWGSTRFPGQRVGRDYVLSDRDVIELHG
ncbi:MAG TPA: GTPase [Dehalococcoidia bacterium]|nr:GTPase [Dehalococcoidia bacterium]